MKGENDVGNIYAKTLHIQFGYYHLYYIIYHMKNKLIENYYVISHNSLGKTNLIKSNVYSLENLILIKSNSYKLSEILFNKIYTYLNSLNHNIEIIHNSLNINSIDGIIDVTTNIGIINEELYSEDLNINFTINLNEIIENPKYSCDENIENHKKIVKLNYLNVYECMENAKRIHDEWEKVYISNINFDTANEITDDVTKKILQDVKLDKKSMIRERFFGTISPNGATNYVEDIIDDLNYRYFIKGRPGTGKSTLMKKIAANAANRGINVDMYYCASDPNSLDMLVLKEIDTCIFDSTPPHEFFPYRTNDFIVDMYNQLLPNNFDLDNKDVLDDITNRYSSSVQQSILELKEIEKVIERFENQLCNIFNLDKLEKKYNEILEILPV